MSEAEHIDSINASWFLYAEDGEPMGRIYRKGRDAIPSVGAQITNAAGIESAEVVSFEELSPTCLMRRYKVVIRVTS